MTFQATAHRLGNKQAWYYYGHIGVLFCSGGEVRERKPLQRLYYLKSYDSIVAAYDPDENRLYLGPRWDYSQTTIKHVKAFVKEVAPWSDTWANITAGDIRSDIAISASGDTYSTNCTKVDYFINTFGDKYKW